MTKETTPGTILRRLRRERIWSQKDVADNIDTTKENVSLAEMQTPGVLDTHN